MTKKRIRYTDKFRASAIVMLEAAGYPQRIGALTEVSRKLNVPLPTLTRWYTRQQSPPPNELVISTRVNMADELEAIVWKMMHHVKRDDVIDEMGGRETSQSIGVLIDKMRLLRGLPTEIVAVIPDVVQALQSMGQDPVSVFQRIIDRAAQEQAQTFRD